MGSGACRGLHRHRAKPRGRPSLGRFPALVRRSRRKLDGFDQIWAGFPQLAHGILQSDPIREWGQQDKSKRLASKTLFCENAGLPQAGSPGEEAPKFRGSGLGRTALLSTPDTL